MKLQLPAAVTKHMTPRNFVALLGLCVLLAIVLVICYLQKPPPAVVQSPPETKVVEKVVYAKNPTPLPPPPAPPPPALDPTPPPVPSAEPEPPLAATMSVATMLAPGVWDGVWRRKGYPLPMFRLSQSGDSVAGTCAANWSAVVPFRDGVASGDSAEFVVDDQVFRVHVRMTMLGDGQAKVEQWVTDEDWETSLERASRAARTPQQALLARLKLELDAKKFRKPLTVGVFMRQSGE